MLDFIEFKAAVSNRLKGKSGREITNRTDLEVFVNDIFHDLGYETDDPNELQILLEIEDIVTKKLGISNFR